MDDYQDLLLFAGRDTLSAIGDEIRHLDDHVVLGTTPTTSTGMGAQGSEHKYAVNGTPPGRQSVLSGMQRDFIAATFVLLLYFLVGYAFYNDVEGWDWVDTVYFSICTITTVLLLRLVGSDAHFLLFGRTQVGYGDLHAVKDSSKIFTIFYQFIGFALAGAALVTMANIILAWQEKYTKQLGKS